MGTCVTPPKTSHPSLKQVQLKDGSIIKPG